MKKERYLQELQRDEAFHARIYARLLEKNSLGNYHIILKKLRDLEVKHANQLKLLLKREGIAVLPSDRKRIELAERTLSMLFGISFAIKFMEYNKLVVTKKLQKVLKKFDFNTLESEALAKLSKEEDIEDKLSNQLLKSNFVLKNVRDVIFGMNDGLVEVLAAAVGFAEVLQIPIVILVATLLVALAGALSMAGGAYLSTKYALASSSKNSAGKAIKSAFYTGIFYMCGAIVPIFPFAFGMLGNTAIVFSVFVTAAVVTFTSSIIAILNNESIAKRIVEALVITMGASAAAIVIGIYARMALNINI
ncbi:MAG: VIT1/CCC1 transporter family protein [Candidatus Micrarchaeaceae archaeon]